MGVKRYMKKVTKSIFSKNMNYYVRNDRGMATLEAVVIIPISFTVIFLLIWTGLLFYNRNVLDHAASRAAINASQHSGYSNKEVCDIVINKFSEYTNGKTIILENTEIDVSVSYGTIKVNVRGDMGIPGDIFFGNVYGDRKWDIDITKETARLRPSSFVRTVSRVKNGLDSHNYEEDQGFEEVSEKKGL